MPTYNQPPVVILAAGANSRFFPLNTNQHKAATELLGKTLIARLLENLANFNYKQVLVIISPRDHQGELATHINNLAKQLNINLNYTIQPEPTGAGNGLLLAKDSLPEQFFLINPTTVENVGELLNKLTHTAEESKTLEAVVASTTQEPWLYGILTTNKQMATSIVEKPQPGSQPSNTKIEGMYLLSQRYLDLLSNEQPSEYSLEVALNKLMQDHPIPVVMSSHEIKSLKFAWHLFDMQQALFSQLKSYVDASAVIHPTAIIDESAGAVHIAAGAKISPYSRIVGPCYIGENTLVGDFALIRQSNMEKNSVAGAYSELVRSILLPGSTFHSGYIADSIIGANTQIGAGMVVANKRHNRQNIRTKIKNEMIDTGRDTLGTIIGANARISIACRITPGVLIGADTLIYPGLTIMKNINHQQVITADERL